jgi:hypothetical protein
MTDLYSSIEFVGRNRCPDTVQLIHSGVLLLSASVAPKNKVAAVLFTAGMTMFSGSIYLLVLDPQRFKALGPVTPLGGKQSRYLVPRYVVPNTTRPVLDRWVGSARLR